VSLADSSPHVHFYTLWLPTLISSCGLYASPYVLLPRTRPNLPAGAMCPASRTRTPSLLLKCSKSPLLPLFNHRILPGSTADLSGLYDLVSTSPGTRSRRLQLTWICHWNLGSGHNAESTLDGWCADKHNWADRADDDREEDGGLFVGSPGHVLDGRPPEMRRDHGDGIGLFVRGCRVRRRYRGWRWWRNYCSTGGADSSRYVERG